MMGHNNQFFIGRRRIPGILGILALVMLFELMLAGRAQAVCLYIAPGYCRVEQASNLWWRGIDPQSMPPLAGPPFTDKMQNFIMNKIYDELIIQDLWDKAFLPTLQGMTAQIVAADYYQAGVMGGFLDGVAANHTMMTIQGLQAEAYKNYTPGEGLCRFGTNTRSLAASRLKAQNNLVALASIAQARQLGTKGDAAAQGMIMDRAARIDQFTRLYCDPADNDGKLGPICGGTAPRTSPTRFNKDVSILRTVLAPQTLNIDLTDGVKTDDEEDVLALASNLYGHDVLKRLTEIAVAGAQGNQTKKIDYLELRQLVAFRNIAQASFNGAVARRTKGAGAVQPFMTAALQEMGMSAVEAAKVLDDNTGAPSYHAQMEVLTKTLYQNPNFYAHLVDKPANVDRQIAAMQAIGLMQERDMQESLKQQELLLSLVLEMKLRREQREVERALGRPRETP